MKQDKKHGTGNIWEIDRPKSVKDKIVETIIKGITDGDLPFGSVLPSESALCKQMGFSRVTIREAIKQLEVLGFLRVGRGNATVVTRPDFKCIESIVESIEKTNHVSIEDLHQLRMMIEVEAVGMVAEQDNGTLADRLDEIINEAEQRAAEESGYVELDFEFHREILEACPNKLLPMLMAPFSSYLRRSRQMSFSGVEAVHRTMRVHRKIIAAIRKNDSDEARAIMKKHLLKTASQLKLGRRKTRLPRR